MLIISVYVSFLMMISPLANTETATTSEYLWETTTTGIGYGRPTAACDGTGVCFVSSSLTGKFDMEDNFGMADITVSRSGSVSRIHALAKSMTKKTIEKHFSGKHFIMKDPYKGTLEIGGKSLKINIPAGNHRIKKTKTGFLLEVNG